MPVLRDELAAEGAGTTTSVTSADDVRAARGRWPPVLYGGMLVA